MAHPRRYSESEELSIVNLYLAGISSTRIAALYGCTSARIGKILNRRGIQLRSTRRFTTDEARDIAMRYQRGESTARIASDLGVKHPTVVNALKYAGVPLRDRAELAKRRVGRLHPNHTTGKRCGESFYKRMADTVLPKHCERCGSAKDLVVHHQNGIHTDNRPMNWERLCRPCHAGHHRMWEDRRNLCG